jgi:hypothetical protein
MIISILLSLLSLKYHTLTRDFVNFPQQKMVLIHCVTSCINYQENLDNIKVFKKGWFYYIKHHVSVNWSLLSVWKNDRSLSFSFIFCLIFFFWVESKEFHWEDGRMSLHSIRVLRMRVKDLIGYGIFSATIMINKLNNLNI